MKIYAIALVAFAPIEDASPPVRSGENSVLRNDLPLGTLSNALPALIPAETMEAAIARCREYALERWKPEEGWYDHQANILPVTQAFYDAAFAAYNAGIIDMTDEPGQSVML